MITPSFPEELINFDGEKLDFVFHQSASDSRTVIVLGHGVTGHKDRPFLVQIAEGLAAKGLNVLRFSWSGNGESEGEFSASNITKEVRDLDAIIGILISAGYRIAYAGHSMGGAVGVRRAAEDDRIEWLISLAGIVHTASFAQSAFGHLVPEEGLMFDKPGLILPAAYMADLNGLDTLIDEVDQIKVPWLLIHGTNDPVVPHQDSRDAYARATGDKTYVELPGIDHLFEPEAIPRVVKTAADWCLERFGRS